MRERVNANRVFFLARHGETDWNAAGRWQGQTDIPLNDVGRAQAEAIAPQLRAEGIAGIASSDLARARETAEIVGRGLGLGLAYVDAAFRERAYGIFEGLTREECEARWPAEWARFERDPNALAPGVESLASVGERMLAGLRHVIARGDAEPDARGGPWLIVSHGRAIRTLTSLVAEPASGLAVLARTPLKNGAIYRFVVESGVPVSVTPFAPGG